MTGSSDPSDPQLPRLHLVTDDEVLRGAVLKDAVLTGAITRGARGLEPSPRLEAAE